MYINEKIEQLIAPSINDMGFDIVRILLSGDRRQTLQIMIERQDGNAVGVEDCENVSRSVSAILDVEDPISSAYSLEVSSPGIDRPLVKPEHFKRYVSFLIKMETKMPIEGRKRFKGVLKSIDENNEIEIEVEGNIYHIPFSELERAKLVLTDELIAKATN